MYTWWLELYPTGVESFPGYHGGMGSLFSTCYRQPQVMTTTCTMEHCLNSALLFFNPRRACAARVTVVGSVCVSVKSHLTSGASVRPENAVTYSAGNECQNICGVFSETAPLQRSSTPSVDGHTYSRPFFLRKAARMRIIVFTTCGGVDRSCHFFPVPVQS